MPSGKRFPPAMPDQVLCKAHLRTRLERSRNKMQQREAALTDGSVEDAADSAHSDMDAASAAGNSPACETVPSTLTRARPAEGSGTAMVEAVAMVAELGFSPEAAEAALLAAAGDLEAAVEALLTAAGTQQLGPMDAPLEHGGAGSSSSMVGPVEPPRLAPAAVSAAHAAGAAALRRAEAAAAAASTALAGRGTAPHDGDSVKVLEPLSPDIEHGELDEMNDFLAALDLQQEELEHL
eukprot:jgi/Tetstr1/448160/TSEL_035452.t1